MRPGLWDDGRLALPNGLRLTLQRSFAEDWRPGDDRPPRSYGRLPFAPAPNGVGFAIPILRDEHVWIGLERPDPPMIANVSLAPWAGGAALTRTCPPDHAIKGIPAGDVYRAIAAGDVLRLSIETAPVSESYDLRLIACTAGQVLGSAALAVLAALDRRTGFSGVRLP